MRWRARCYLCLIPGLSQTGQLIETRKLAKRAAASDLDLAQVTARILGRTPHAKRFLLVVDQFEELFTPAKTKPNAKHS